MAYKAVLEKSLGRGGKDQLGEELPVRPPGTVNGKDRQGHRRDAVTKPARAPGLQRL